ncbi:MAG: RrF2 family transcriptional regulator [Eubacterium sp.]|nr:RrF2 family transcriptional regulator [Eubacterium sp.]
MLVSTRGRYALRVLIDIAQNGHDEPIPLMDIAERQGISEKYLESIMGLLSKKGFVDAHRGKGGGYKLSRPASEYTVLSILQITEGTLAPVTCLESDEQKCEKAEECCTVGMWTHLYDIITDYLGSVTLEDLIGVNDGQAD